jgi:mRNA interferase MazF
MRRGDVRLVDLDPVRGSEASKRRPAVVISNDRANATAERLRRGVITVVPLTSSTARVCPFQVLLPAARAGLRVDAKAEAEQVRAVDFERVGPALSQLPRRSWPRSTTPYASASTCSRRGTVETTTAGG